MSLSMTELLALKPGTFLKVTARVEEPDPPKVIEFERIAHEHNEQGPLVVVARRWWDRQTNGSSKEYRVKGTTWRYRQYYFELLTPEEEELAALNSLAAL